MDEIDAKILRMLQTDARTPFKEIASRCNVSTDTVKNRFDAMKKKGVIKGVTIVINPQGLSNKCVALIGVETVRPYSHQVLNMVRKLPDVCVATRAMGYYDIEVITILKDIEQVSEVKEQIENFPQVRDVHTNIWVGKYLLCPQNFEFEV